MAEAEDVRKYMNYKGRNAASARLNMLHRKGELKKIKSGRKIYFMLI